LNKIKNNINLILNRENKKEDQLIQQEIIIQAKKAQMISFNINFDNLLIKKNFIKT